jgi:transposase
MQTTLILLLIISDIVMAPNIDPLRASITNEEQRAFIKCHVLLCSTVPKISKMLTKIAGRKAIKMRQIYNIYNQFRNEGRTSCQDEPRSGRPWVATDE